VIRGSDEESEYVVPVNTHKKQIRARDTGSERSYHRTIGHRRQIEVISPVSDESIQTTDTVDTSEATREKDDV